MGPLHPDQNAHKFEWTLNTESRQPMGGLPGAKQLRWRRLPVLTLQQMVEINAGGNVTVHGRAMGVGYPGGLCTCQPSDVALAGVNTRD